MNRAYIKDAEKSQKNLFESKKISEKNKTILRRFFHIYNVSPARLNIFCRQIVHFLEAFEDIEELTDEELYSEDRFEAKKKKQKARDKVNKFFYDFRHRKTSRGTQISSSYYETVVSVTLRLVKWLNEDNKPYSFKDIKGNKKDRKRDLVREDMITESERDLLIKTARTIQMKAILAIQISLGMRPSELLNLKYNDILSIEKNIMIIRIKDGKTGPRQVVGYFATPFLVEWLDNHPTKKPNDFLWVSEQPNKSRAASEVNVKSRIAAVKKRIGTVMRASGLTKPYDLYSLRHSACFISKMNNTPVEFASQNFGHSIEEHEKTYARLAPDDRAEQYQSFIDSNFKEEQKNISCPVCDMINAASTKHCKKCARPLTLEGAFEEIDKKEELEQKIIKMDKRMDQLTKAVTILTSD